MSAPAAPRLVALRALHLGDMLAAVPALRALARAFPHHRRLLACSVQWRELIGAIGLPFEVVDSDLARTPDPVLRGADVAVNLHGRGPHSTAWLAHLMPRQLIAFGLTCSWDEAEHERVRWCRLLRAAGIDADPEDLHVTLPPGSFAAAVGGATVVHPGASAGSRRWPPDRWARVGRAETDAGHPVLVTGTAAELPLARAVAESAGLPSTAVLAGRTDPVDLLHVVGRAGLVVCGDTGVAHVASALRVPSVLLFGPTSPAAWGPPAGPHRVLWRGATGDPRSQAPHAGLLAIGVHEVVDACRAMRAEGEARLGLFRVG